MGTDHGLGCPHVFIDFHDVVFCRRPSPREKGKLPLPSVTIHLLGYMCNWCEYGCMGQYLWSWNNEILHTFEIYLHAMYNHLQLPTVDRYWLTTDPATACGGSNIFIDFQLVVALHNHAAQSW